MSQTNQAMTEATTTGDGRIYWRSMEQLSGSAEYQRFLEREFQDNPDVPPTDAVSRRRFLGLVAAAVAMASTTACRKPVRKILPFGSRPEDLVPGLPRHYATTLQMGGYGTGVLVRSNDGRPTKIEGNKVHPSSLGGTSGYMQGEVLNLYDPARSQSPSQDGADVTAKEFAQFWSGLKGGLGDGGKLAFLMRPTTSPTIAHMVAQVKDAFPQAAFHSYAPVNRDNETEGARLAFGQAVDPQYRYDQADVIVALDSDFMSHDVNSVRHARDFASRRKPQDDVNKLNRLYAVESVYSITGGQADHRFRVRASEVGSVAFALAAELGVLTGPLQQAVAKHKQHGFQKNGVNWVAAIAEDLVSKRGKSLVVAGPKQPPVVHAVVHAINSELGNAGNTVSYKATPALLADNQAKSIEALTAKMEAGAVDTLFILGGNPVYDAPADLAFGQKLAKVAHRIHLGLHRDETAAACNWHVNGTHELEAWGDILSYDGTASIVQPLIAPLYGGMSDIELLAMIADYDEKAGYEIVRYYWEEQAPSEGFDAWWNRALHDGLMHGSAPASAPAQIRVADVATAVTAVAAPAAASASSLEVTFAQDGTIYDGRYSNNAWMQECPDPITKLSWDNAAVMSPATAKELGVSNGDLVELTVGGRKQPIAAWIAPGQADYSVALTIGYGRALGDSHEVAHRTGFDTCMLRGKDGFNIANGATLEPTGESYSLSTSQEHGSLEGRDHYRESDVAGFKENARFAPEMSPLAQAAMLQKDEEGNPLTEQDLLKSLWTERDYTTGNQWGMVIDLNSCNGCNACVVACQSENNIPSVGKEQIRLGREMLWLRVDRYFYSEKDGTDAASTEEPAIKHQPVPCMQCENAPCESVCPVAATTHTPEGLNDMVYNRCIGTRYCANNCPYKVRRFNFLDFIGKIDPTLQMVQNPDVTIRTRGVMEKCTYCVQRITGAKHQAKREDRAVMDGEVTPACGQACPSKAITFGNIVDEKSEISKLRKSPLNYAMLSELNVKPRTTYLAKIRNPNPKLLT